MEEIGIRQLKQHASALLRRVREQRETIAITYRGRVVARLVPAEDLKSKQADIGAIWAEMDELAQEIGAHWPPEISAEEAVQEQRREL